MKKILGLLIAVTAIVALFSSCREEGYNLRPGLWTSEDVINTYPGDTVTIEGQASCYTGLARVIITCDEWDVDKVYELSNQKPNVWNFEYSFIVPTDAEFNQDLHITVTDKNGNEQKKTITMKYVPATDAPNVVGLQSEQAVEYNTTTGTGILALDLALTSGNVLQSAKLSIPDLKTAEGTGYEKNYTFASPTGSIKENIEFTECGTYPLTVTVTDISGNVGTFTSNIIVMPKENEDEVADYDRMYAFMPSENESDYIFGYYIFMQRKDECAYQVYVYAPTDDTEFFFTPTRETDGDRKFGVSPYVSTKIISKQTQKGYVKGYKPGKGYWGLWVDVKKQTISQWALEESEGDKSTLYCSADWNGWKFDQMNSGATDYQKTYDATIYAGNQYFCFATSTDWKNVWRCWNEDGAIAGWWFSADGSGSGATLPTISANVNATITFDTVTKWCFIKKK